MTTKRGQNRHGEVTAKLRGLFAAAIDAALPAGKITRLPDPVVGATVVLGAGKAAASMAAAFEQAWKRPVSGLVLTRYGHSVPTRDIKVLEAAHPVPDEAGLAAAKSIMATASQAGANDQVVFLGSGGGSALLVLPAARINFATKQRINRALLACGAPIGEVNLVRKAISGIKAGRLAAACLPARVTTYLISDFPDDDLGSIASGPTIAQQVDPEEALGIMRHYQIEVDADLAAAVRANSAPMIEQGDVHLLANAQNAQDAAAARAQSYGWPVIKLGAHLQDTAGALAASQAIRVRELAASGRTSVLLSGGETTVRVKGNGKGGRNMEFLLALAGELAGMKNVYALAADTDGYDGISEHAGAFITPDTLDAAHAAGVNPSACAAANDSERMFAAVDALITTGATCTNVNDFRAIVINPPCG